MHCAYIDTSALVKLVAKEEESDSLQAWMQQSELLMITSDLARGDLLRAVRRTEITMMGRAFDVLNTLDFLTISETTFGIAASLNPVELRTLDALHLSSAIELGESLQAFVAYDKRLLEAVNSVGLRTIVPG